jgi:hypothetical protein
MKKTTFLLSFVIVFVSTMLGQTLKPYPIPSYNVPLDGTALFMEGSATGIPGSGDGRKILNTTVKTQSIGGTGCSATVWYYSLDGMDLLGPYTVAMGITLSVEIDDRQWGVLVDSECEVLVDVWISEATKKPGTFFQKSSTPLTLGNLFKNISAQ